METTGDAAKAAPQSAAPWVTVYAVPTDVEAAWTFALVVSLVLAFACLMGAFVSS